MLFIYWYLLVTAILFGLMVGLLNDEFKLVHTPILFIAALFWPVTITYWFYHHFIKGRNENN